MLEIVIDSRTAAISPEMKVKRILPFRLRRMIGPFGSGISHSERFENPSSLSGGLEMIQTWVALPEKDEESAPSFANYTPDQLSVFNEKGIWMRLIAGDAYGLQSKVKTNSPLFYLHVVLQKGALFGLPKEHSERGFYIVKGSVEIAGVTYTEGKMLVFTKGVDPRIVAKENTTVMLLGGEPLGNASFGGTLFLPEKNASNKPKKIGNKAGLFYHLMITTNSFHCLTITQGRQERRPGPSRFPDDQFLK